MPTHKPPTSLGCVNNTKKRPKSFTLSKKSNCCKVTARCQWARSMIRVPTDNISSTLTNWCLVVICLGSISRRSNHLESSELTCLRDWATSGNNHPPRPHLFDILVVNALKITNLESLNQVLVKNFAQ